jgi:hypothetical protein
MAVGFDAAVAGFEVRGENALVIPLAPLLSEDANRLAPLATSLHLTEYLVAVSLVPFPKEPRRERVRLAATDSLIFRPNSK